MGPGIESDSQELYASPNENQGLWQRGSGEWNLGRQPINTDLLYHASEISGMFYSLNTYKVYLWALSGGGR